MSRNLPTPDSRIRQNPFRVLFWRSVAICSVALALAGAVLPVLPTVPFLILAAWAGGKGWPRLEQWLLEHPRHGPAIQRWRSHGAVSRSAKWLATTAMVFSIIFLLLSSVPLLAKVAVPAIVLGVAVWLWRRPEL